MIQYSHRQPTQAQLQAQAQARMLQQQQITISEMQPVPKPSITAIELQNVKKFDKKLEINLI